MATDKRVGTKGSQAMAQDATVNIFGKPGPFIGIVKNNVDPTRSGRLQVFLAGMGGVEEEPTHWVTVRYASPFFGMTDPTVTTENSWKKVNHTYGMWFTPPDLNNQVLVMFANGDPNNGFWFACVNPTLSHHMVPGMAGATTSKPNLSSDLQSVLGKAYYPVAEFNEYNDDNRANWTEFYNTPKPVHEDSVRTLLRQGLEDDSVRGVISSSSQRESPSSVFGISTPGRVLDRAEDTSVTARSGGHTFVMDDGDVKGTDQLIRFRTAGGHQILMNDSEKVIYIGHANGSTWAEFGSDGKISFYSDNDFSIRSKANINLHADNDINMFAGNNIQQFATKIIKQQSDSHTIKSTTEYKVYGGKIGMVSGTTLDLNAGSTGTWGANTDLIFGANMIYLNDKEPNRVSKPDDVKIYSFPETSKSGLKWSASKTMSTIGSTLPTHEPWQEHFVSTESVTTNLVTSSGTPVSSPVYGGGAASAKGKGVSKRAPLTSIADSPSASGGIGVMTKDEVTALKAQIGYSESTNNYSAVNSIGFIGKYQFGYLALIDRGYIKSSCTKNSQMNDPAYWTGKDGITSKDAYLSNIDVQESIMEAQLNANYKQLVKQAVLGSDSTAAEIAGTLSVAHLLGAGGAASWAKGAGGADAYGTTGDTYYNRGRYAVEVLAKSVNKDTATV